MPCPRFPAHSTGFVPCLGRRNSAESIGWADAVNRAMNRQSAATVGLGAVRAVPIVPASLGEALPPIPGIGNNGLLFFELAKPIELSNWQRPTDFGQHS